MSSSPFVFRLLNPVMKSILKSPFHSMVSNKILIFTFKGRKTGSEYSTPVSYCQENGTIICFTHAGWWQNLVGNAQVRVWIRGQERRGIATPYAEDQDKKIIGLGKLLAAVPSDARFYHIVLDDQGNINQEDLKRAAETATMIEVRLEGPLE